MCCQPISLIVRFLNPRHEPDQSCPPPLNSHSAGFSLVELAIVLVIIGLLVGGVLMGRNLIRNAELQTVVTDFSQFKSAAQQFKDKYMAIPGDFNEATSFWGKDNAACPADSGTAAVPGTCNGNGNMDLPGSTAAGGVTREMFQFWKHLQLDGLIKGDFSGIAGPTRADHAVPDYNGPRSSAGGSAVWAAFTWNHATSVYASATDYGTALFIGNDIGAWPGGAFLTTKEAWNIDTKLDDGHASSGNVWGVRYRDCTLADDTTGTETDHMDYDLGRDDVVCALAFKNVVQ